MPLSPATQRLALVLLLVLALLLTAVSLMPFLTRMSGLIYLAAALVLDAIFIYYALALKHSESKTLPMKVFRFSITYLMWLFAALLIDHYLPTTQNLPL